MAYAVPADLTKYGAPAEALAGISTEVQEDALQAASDELDSCWADRFTLPLSAWPEAVVRYTCWVAIYDLLKTRGLRAGSDDHAILDGDRTKALKWAEKVGMGKLSPAGFVDSTPSVSEHRPVLKSRAKRGW